MSPQWGWKLLEKGRKFLGAAKQDLSQEAKGCEYKDRST